MNQNVQPLEKTATLYRMVMPEHICPYGIKSKWLLESQGYSVADHHLTTREETDAFKAEHDVDTTPQTFIGGKRVGGYDALRDHFGKTVIREGDTTYRPVIAIFSVAFLMGIAISWATLGTIEVIRTLEWFIASAMVLLGLQKLRDVEGFSTMFLNYDLLAKRWVPYGYIYPFAETLAGLLMLAGALMWLSVPLALFIGSVGAASVFKDVYVDKRELKCACVGGGSNVPLGFVSLTENLMMIAMAVWMPVRHGM
ncbi:MauE/DoxX family redox-associated membrane protein [Pelagibacterium lentulum]|uniref:Methylamine utilization protein MauE n=1 Tax=Pelagibacterium lentulum TaxID=2029865 RepID=A0A916VW34_9HYPH|nr:glutaredoxin [Pelagibacterium lentulum]GGA43298.1 membrane protein [Pelagibacterium lentulum]